MRITTMRLGAILLVACAVLGVQAQLSKGTNGLPKDLRIMMTNSAGWFDYSIRLWFHTLLDRGCDVVLSAPAKDMTLNFEAKVGYGEFNMLISQKPPCTLLLSKPSAKL